jgi:hypothetical protein
MERRGQSIRDVRDRRCVRGECGELRLNALDLRSVTVPNRGRIAAKNFAGDVSPCARRAGAVAGFDAVAIYILSVWTDVADGRFTPADLPRVGRTLQAGRYSNVYDSPAKVRVRLQSHPRRPCPLAPLRFAAGASNPLSVLVDLTQGGRHLRRNCELAG